MVGIGLQAMVLFGSRKLRDGNPVFFKRLATDAAGVDDVRNRERYSEHNARVIRPGKGQCQSTLIESSAEPRREIRRGVAFDRGMLGRDELEMQMSRELLIGSSRRSSPRST